MARTRNLADRVLAVTDAGRVPGLVAATTGVDSSGVAAATGATIGLYDRRSPWNKAAPGLTQNTNGTTLGTWDFATLSGLKLYTTTTVAAAASGTSNRPSGKFILASGGATYTLTNSFISATSIVDCDVETAGTTAKIISTVPAAGSVVITLSANVGADTTISFVVVNGN